MIMRRIASQLQPGDILPDPRRVITQIGTAPRGFMPEGVVAWVSRLGSYAPGASMSPTPPVTFGPDALVDVEVPDLTPAQARADEVVDLLEQIIGEGKTVETLHAGRRFLDELRPKPPTMDEVLRALDDLRGEVEMTSAQTRAADAILDRARRTGLLK